MPTTIPYDPSLALGNIVNQEKLDNIEAIAQIQAPVNAAQDQLNSLMSMKHSLDMTIINMSQMGISAPELAAEDAKVVQDIQQAGINYAKTKLAAEQKIQPLKAKISMVNSSDESPIDYLRSQLKSMPLSADSMVMNCQYFSFDSETESSQSQAQKISNYSSHSFSEGFFVSTDYKDTNRNTTQSQVHSQYEAHDIQGTLVISINCTHQNARVFAPYVLNIDKAIRVWNNMFPKDRLNTMDPQSIMAALENQGKGPQNEIKLLSGATYGSSFVGMVHVMNDKSTTTMQQMNSVAQTMQTQMTGGCWFSSANGGWGSDNSFSDSAKSLLSNHNVSSHCTLSVMGAIPSMKANSVKMGIDKFTDFSGEASMEKLANLQNATATDQNSLEANANAARTGAQLSNLSTAAIKPTLSALSDNDTRQNKILDTNSMVDSMEDYINKCATGKIGIPINYYLKPITKTELAEAYIRKYFPSKFDIGMSTADDSTDKTSTNTTAN